MCKITHLSIVLCSRPTVWSCPLLTFLQQEIDIIIPSCKRFPSPLLNRWYSKWNILISCQARLCTEYTKSRPLLVVYWFRVVHESPYSIWFKIFPEAQTDVTSHICFSSSSNNTYTIHFRAFHLCSNMSLCHGKQDDVVFTIR